MLLDSAFPHDLRVENEAGSLITAGHEVYLLCLSFSRDEEKNSRYNDINLRRFIINRNLAKKGRALIATRFDFYSSLWSNRITAFINENNIDVLHVHDLYLLGAAYKSNERFNLPIVSDLHENYPAALENYKFTKTFPGKYIISVDRWKQVEKDWACKADKVITVIEEAVERYLALGVEEKRMHVVANYVNLNEFKTSGPPQRDDDMFTATYVGGFDIHRGIEYLIKAVPYIVEKIPEFKLVLVGSGRNYEDLKQLADSLEVNKYISFEGYQKHDLLPNYIFNSDICLIPHLKTTHTDNTIPHKLFQYMYLKKPVVSSNCKPIERILNESKAGLVYQYDNPRELADCIIKIHDDPVLREEMGQKGYSAVKEKYSWDTAAKELIKIYEDLSR
jgi:glycosyltransferase involved in cell wall biosynthesis